MFIVILTRAGFFLLSPLGIPLEAIGLTGAGLLILLRGFRMKKGIKDIIKKTPWHILLFSFDMYVLVYGLKNIGLNVFLVSHLKPLITESSLGAITLMGLVTTIFSNTFNNLPAVMIGTLSLTEMRLEPHFLQAAYLASVIGSDIGSLLTPVGTLATLIWMFILKKNSVHLSWGRYLRITFLFMD
jgi:arsenical pump membrane protein